MGDYSNPTVIINIITNHPKERLLPYPNGQNIPSNGVCSNRENLTAREPGTLPLSALAHFGNKLVKETTPPPSIILFAS